MSDSNLPASLQRKRPIHLPAMDSGNRSIVVFLTVCTANRCPILASEKMHRIVVDSWGYALHWQVGRYVVMPDHIHLFCAPNTYPSSPLASWVRYWKSRVAKVSGAGPGALWQKNFWDTQLRHANSYAAKWEYVRNNPVRHGLVQRAEDWPFQGVPNELRWHD